MVQVSVVRNNRQKDWEDCYNLQTVWFIYISQFSRSVLSESLRLHGLKHARLPCPSSTPAACSNSCPLSRWCHPTISSSVVPFSCPQSFPTSGSFPMSQLFASGGQSIGVSAWLKLKWLIMPIIGKDKGLLELSYTGGRSVKVYNSFGKLFDSCL